MWQVISNRKAGSTYVYLTLSRSVCVCNLYDEGNCGAVVYYASTDFISFGSNFRTQYRMFLAFLFANMQPASFKKCPCGESYQFGPADWVRRRIEMLSSPSERYLNKWH